MPTVAKLTVNPTIQTTPTTRTVTTQHSCLKDQRLEGMEGHPGGFLLLGKPDHKGRNQPPDACKQVQHGTPVGQGRHGAFIGCVRGNKRVVLSSEQSWVHSS